MVKISLKLNNAIEQRKYTIVTLLCKSNWLHYFIILIKNNSLQLLTTAKSNISITLWARRQCTQTGLWWLPGTLAKMSQWNFGKESNLQYTIVDRESKGGIQYHYTSHLQRGSQKSSSPKNFAIFSLMVNLCNGKFSWMLANHIRTCIPPILIHLPENLHKLYHFYE